MNKQTPVKLLDLEEALLFVEAGNGFETTVWVSRETGTVLWHSDEAGDFEPLPEDIDDAARYVAVPGKHELGLGKPLAMEFARTYMPTCYEQVRAMFSRRGAYARFRNLLERQQSVEAWHQWETQQTRQALRDWCAENGLTLAD